METPSLEPTNQKSKVSNVLKLTNKKNNKTLGTSVIYSPMSPPSLSNREYISLESKPKKTTKTNKTGLSK